MKAKSCRSGYYWCFTDKKCKKIPVGYHIGARGYLYPDKDDDGNSDGNGNGKNGNGNGGNHSGSSGSNGGSGSGGVSEGTTMQENFKRINQNGQTYAVMLQFRGRTYNIQMFIPRQTRPTRLEVQKEVNKIYPGAIVRYFEPRVWDPANPALVMPEQMQPGAKDLVQQSDYMKPALQQKPKKKKHTCGEGVTLKKVSEVFDHKIDPKQFKKDKRDAKIGNLARKTTNPGEKAAAEKKSKGPKLFGEDTVRVEGRLGYVEFIDLIKPEPMKGIAERTLTKGEDNKKEDIVKGMKKSFKGFRDRYGDDAKSVMYATATKLAKEEKEHDVNKTTMPNVSSKDKKAINARAKNIFKKDLKGEHVSVNEIASIGPSKKERIEKSDEMQNPKPILQRVLNTVGKLKGKNGVKEQLAPHIKKGVAAAKPLVKAQALQTGLPTTKEKPKPPEKKDSKSIFSQLTNKDEID